MKEPNIAYNANPGHSTTSKEGPGAICRKDIALDELILGEIVARKLYLAIVQQTNVVSITYGPKNPSTSVK
jgi:hypothetical protein